MKAIRLAKMGFSSLKNEGFSATLKRVKHYIRGDKNDKGDQWKIYADVLFINGCYLPHPPRYRCTHQMEQLLAGGITSQVVGYTELDLDLVRNYRAFVFFRCPYTEMIGKFIKKAKELNKLVVYDIDDLLFDEEYVKTVTYLDSMEDEEKEEYYEGIKLNRKTLQLCDYAITTTERLAKELNKYVPNVYINRNVASDRMLQLSQKAIKRKAETQVDKDKVILGYFSGSITHNQDFDMILPVIQRCMKKYENLYLTIVGELDLPEELTAFKKRIITQPFVEWEQLPEIIASVDINLAPLTDSVFNEAKSENKWLEAALVQVPTIASNIGAFHTAIRNEETGILCNTESDWEKALDKLIEDAVFRKQLGINAYQYVSENCVTLYSAYGICNFFREHFTPNIIFVLPVLQISGGALVVLKHCEILRKHGYDVTIFNEGSEDDLWVEKDGVSIPVFNKAKGGVFGGIDKAVATFWSTVDFVNQYPNIGQRMYLVQGYETNFSEPGSFFRFRANQSYYLQNRVKYITISKWCEGWLKERYHQESVYAPNGIYSERFYPVERNFNSGKIRILIEGNSDDFYKNVDEGFAIVDQLDLNKFEIWYMSYQGTYKESYHVDKFLHKVPYEEVPDVYRQCHILIKTSILESFSYPPLEMMATGGMVVVAPNSGNVEYLEDHYNCLMYDQGDIDKAVKCIEQICADAELRKILYKNGIATAQSREWENIKDKIISLYN